MYFNQPKEKVVAQFQSDVNTGLTSYQVADLQKKYGWNELTQKKATPFYVKFLLKFKDYLMILLILAAVISMIVDPHEWVESVIIFIVVIFNAFLGAYQENNAEKSLEALKKMSSPTAKVIRDGVKIEIPSKEVVVGDIFEIMAGDFIPTDGRILQSFNLQVDESALTGESVPVNKIDDVIEKEKLPLGDQKNMVFASTVSTYGRAIAIATSIGMDNQVGKIADMLNRAESEETPLQLKLKQISKLIGYMCLVICAIVFGLELVSGLGILDAFKTSVALAVAAVPEGLATVVTIVLAIGVKKMASQNAIIRTLASVETLGSCSIICSDKTGTLTQNKMTVVKTYQNDKGIEDFTTTNTDVKEMITYFALCSDGQVKEEASKLHMIGDPTETALVYALYQYGITKESLNSIYKRVDEIAFDSSRKMMSVFFQTEHGVLQLTKGAPDVVISRCKEELSDALQANETMANQALRVLALGIKQYEVMPEVIDESLEQDLTFVGLVGMIDPPRLEVKDAIAQAKSGGIKTIMITGDHLTTAKAIAADLGIFNEGDHAITGQQLDEISDEALLEEIKHITVYARVAPEHKVCIVNTWQKLQQVVAMTGDGVNDSPALKSADIGCAMGITGTDVSKNAADMILTDDNFATIIAAVKQGRGIYANIKKDVQFLLSSNIGEVITIFLASLLGLIPGLNMGIPLLPIHLLWVNLITDSLPAFAIGMEQPENVMHQKPRPKNESFFAGGLGFTIIWQGIMIGLITLTAYMYGLQTSHTVAMTMAFVTLSLGQLVHSFNVKSEKSILNKTMFNNKYLIYAFVVGILLQVMIINVPFLSNLFSLTALSMTNLLVSIGLAFLPLVIVEIAKWLKYKA
ncbi:MAG: calcium-translocating P-type ATPase, PMCA-type [Erysipelotrichaceae bacterium]|nr:calcium-translocating P-type ATPase, PMCA-type [Erysipelotrichaceae bacterium]